MNYAICSTAKEDVLKCLREMITKKHTMPIMQFGAKKYRELEKDHSQVSESCKKVEKELIYSISLNTLKVHKDTCGCKGGNTVKARLARLRTTGLMNCQRCMA